MYSRLIFVILTAFSLSACSAGLSEGPLENSFLSGKSDKNWNRSVKLAARTKVSCLPQKLKDIVTRTGGHFGKPVTVTSGHRSVRQNRRVGGVRGSFHTRCLAVDIRVKGVSKSRLARFIRRLPDRGGLGTYCGKGIVHVDLGPRREWHFGCRKKRIATSKRSKSWALKQRSLVGKMP